MSFRDFIKRPLYRTPRLLAALMKLKPGWNPDAHAFLQLIQNGDSVLDIGANVGIYSELFARVVGPTGRVIAFEPVPTTFAQLQKRLAGFPQITLHQLAVSNQPGDVVLNLPGEDSGQASLKPHHQASWSEPKNVQQHHARAITLDRWAEEAGWLKIDFIKLDIEGAELLALRGSSQLVHRNQPMLFIEVWQDWLVDFGFKPQDLADWLLAHNYDCFAVVKDKTTLLGNLDADWAPHLNSGPHNLLAARRDRHAARLRCYSI